MNLKRTNQLLEGVKRELTEQSGAPEAAKKMMPELHRMGRSLDGHIDMAQRLMRSPSQFGRPEVQEDGRELGEGDEAAYQRRGRNR